jgi:DNA-binding LytR/AlgR family response regulator
MKEMGGIETAEIIRKYDKNCVIIIITAILEYAVDGYSINAFEFILKPINKDKFDKVLIKAIHKVQFFDNQTYVIEVRERTLVLRLSSIIYFESLARKVLINCDDAIYENNENITTVEEKLKEKGFIRISRYYLVNLRHIKEVGVNDIVLSNGSALNYSHKFTNDIKKKYMEYMMEGII